MILEHECAYPSNRYHFFSNRKITDLVLICSYEIFVCHWISLSKTDLKMIKNKTQGLEREFIG